MSDFQFVAVDIHKGVWEGDPTPRWFLNAHVNDGSEIIVDMKLSHWEARRSAKEMGVPITDHAA